jgi:hypothetical protein
MESFGAIVVIVCSIVFLIGRALAWAINKLLRRRRSLVVGPRPERNR